MLAVCNEAHQMVVPQGGMTGLSGGAIPRASDIALSLDRMAGIEEIDTASAAMTVLAGTTLQTAQEADFEAGFELALDLRGTVPARIAAIWRLMPGATGPSSRGPRASRSSDSRLCLRVAPSSVR